MAGGHLNPLLHGPSRLALLKSFKPCLYNPSKRYSQESKGSSSLLTEERAPSIAEEFERVAKEKLEEAAQSVASQTEGKRYDAAEDPALGDSKVESGKKRYNQHEPGVGYHRKGENK